jgi:type II secretion system protein C
VLYQLRYICLIAVIFGISAKTHAQVLLQKAKPVPGQTLGFLIMGTIAQKTPDNNVALIKIIDSGQVTAVKSGHIIAAKSGYKVTDVSEKYIRVITRQGENFLVYLDKFAGEFRESVGRTPGPAVNPDGNYKEDGFERQSSRVTMTTAYRDRIVNQDLSKILMQATAEPVLSGGLIVGFRLYQIDSDSIFAKGGLHDDDIITALNGLKLNSVAGAIATLKSLKDASTIEIEIIRGGAPKSLSINVR